MSHFPEFDAGAAAGRAGQPLAVGATLQYQQGWRMGDVERRAIAGEVIATGGGATRCAKCQGVDWGLRAGCRCWPMDEAHNPFTLAGLERLHEEGYRIEWGMFALDVKDGERSLRFMGREEAKAAVAAGKLFFDALTGDPVEVKV